MSIEMEAIEMGLTGVVRGRQIELDAPVPFPDGSRVRISVTLEEQPRRGSPEALERLYGTLTDDEADRMLEAERLCRQVDDRLWSTSE
jgi:hypothetical protein